MSCPETDDHTATKARADKLPPWQIDLTYSQQHSNVPKQPAFHPPLRGHSTTVVHFINDHQPHFIHFPEMSGPKRHQSIFVYSQPELTPAQQKCIHAYSNEIGTGEEKHDEWDLNDSDTLPIPTTDYCIVSLLVRSCQNPLLLRSSMNMEILIKRSVFKHAKSAPDLAPRPRHYLINSIISHTHTLSHFFTIHAYRINLSDLLDLTF
jgi:hypothetical protein